jgi:cytochrome c oxidase assembly protein subunit 19
LGLNVILQTPLPPVRLVLEMASNVFGAKKFVPTAPDKGSFPLDHEGECKQFYLKFMICLAEHDSRQSACREESKAYLGCRMDRQLMAKEDWSKLGFSDLDKDKS